MTMVVGVVRLIAVAAFLFAAVTPAALDGGVQIYLQPLAPDAAKLSFALESVAAVSSTGTEYPLGLKLKTLGATEASRQRLLAADRLPVGRYSGFSIKVSRAALKNERGDISLPVPDSAVRFDAPFSVTAGRTPLFWFTLDYRLSLVDGVKFSPAFTAVMPPRPVPAHAGFLTNTDANNITVFDKSLGQAVAVIETCAGPAGMALDQRRQRLYVACRKDDEVQSIDVVTGEILQQVQASPGDRPLELAVTPDGGTLIASNPGSNCVTFFDAISLTRQDRVNVGSGPGSILVDPTGRRAFVFNTQSSSVSVIDIPTRALVTTLSTDATPLRGQFGPGGNKLYVVHDRTPFMTVIDPRQLNVLTRARLSSAAAAIAVDPVRGLVGVVGANDTAIEFYDPNALMPLFTMRTRAGVSFLAVDPEDNRMYMVNPVTRTVIVGNLADRKIVSEIDVGNNPYWVAVMGEK
jgi:YVTN family beta-propeller protein